MYKGLIRRINLLFTLSLIMFLKVALFYQHKYKHKCGMVESLMTKPIQNLKQIFIFSGRRRDPKKNLSITNKTSPSNITLMMMITPLFNHLQSAQNQPMKALLNNLRTFSPALANQFCNKQMGMTYTVC